MHIKSVFEESGQTYGSPRIHQELRESGIACGRRRIARLMRSQGIRPALARRFVVTTDTFTQRVDSRHALPVADNVLDRQFEAEAPDRRCSGDITYVWTREGWLYLSVLLDLFSRRVLGWFTPA